MRKAFDRNSKSPQSYDIISKLDLSGNSGQINLVGTTLGVIILFCTLRNSDLKHHNIQHTNRSTERITSRRGQGLVKYTQVVGRRPNTSHPQKPLLQWNGPTLRAHI